MESFHLLSYAVRALILSTMPVIVKYKASLCSFTLHLPHSTPHTSEMKTSEMPEQKSRGFFIVGVERSYPAFI